VSLSPECVSIIQRGPKSERTSSSISTSHSCRLLMYYYRPALERDEMTKWVLTRCREWHSSLQTASGSSFVRVEELEFGSVAKCVVACSCLPPALISPKSTARSKQRQVAPSSAYCSETLTPNRSASSNRIFYPLHSSHQRSPSAR
jgi:hypothetical protein